MNSEKHRAPRDTTAADGPQLEMFLGYKLKRTFDAIHANLLASLRPFDLRLVTYSALAVILDREGLRQAELAEALRIDRGNAVAIVDELEGRRLITRNRHPDDRRSYALHLTDAGRALCLRALASDRDSQARILAGMDGQRLQDLLADLEHIEAAALAELNQRTDSQDS